MKLKSVIRSCAGPVAGVLLWGPAGATMPVPPLPPAGQADFHAYLEAPDHAAFAVAPGGAWGWVSGQRSAAEAGAAAMAACQARTAQQCVPYAEGSRVVFDARNWSRLWGPYASAGEARRAPVGHLRGQRMADLSFTDAGGQRRSVSTLKGRVVVLHFWGAWCPPCRQEMPDMQKLQVALAGRPDIVFVLLQAREKFLVSRLWAEQQGIRMPLYDSGSTGEDDTQFRLSGGRRVADREIASRFPTTYVLDKRGLVVFSHVGPVHDWMQYEPFLKDVAERSGR
jgi:thiol-disulfide isomerase/thioredoxin